MMTTLIKTSATCMVTCSHTVVPSRYGTLLVRLFVKLSKAMCLLRRLWKPSDAGLKIQVSHLLLRLVFLAHKPMSTVPLERKIEIGWIHMFRGFVGIRLGTCQFRRGGHNKSAQRRNCSTFEPGQTCSQEPTISRCRTCSGSPKWPAALNAFT